MNEMSNITEDILPSLLKKIDPGLLRLDGIKIDTNFSSVFIFAHIHCLPSYAELFHLLVENFSFRRDNIIIIPKSYSAIHVVIHELKMEGFKLFLPEGNHVPGFYDLQASVSLKKACHYAKSLFQSERQPTRAAARTAILLDDGGLLTETWHKMGLEKDVRSVSVQQTASGLRRKPSYGRMNKINVAGSAAKRWFESRIIAGGVARKIIGTKEPLRGKQVGVIGYGAIGQAVADAVLPHAGDVRVYDRATGVGPKNCENMPDLRSLVNSSEIIIGCTGKNCFASKEDIIDFVRKRDDPRNFISCSSRDIEFQALLLKYAETPADPYSNITLSDRRGIVLNGGFPINFDREREWETDNEISLTRGLILLGIFQSLASRHSAKDPIAENIVPLVPASQKWVVERWLALNRWEPARFGVGKVSFGSIEWWHSESLFGRHALLAEGGV